MKKPAPNDLLYLVVLNDGTYVRKMKWDAMWHLVFATPAVDFFDARYNRISKQRARALIRCRAVV